MGRSLAKRYFGNRNLGTTGTADNGIGGEGIASINWSTVGAFMGTSNVNAITIPALPTPTLPGGVQATWTMEFEVESVTTGAGKTDLAVGDTFAWAPSGADPIPGMVAKVTDLSGANAVFSVTVAGASRGDSMTLANIPDDTQTIVLEKVGGTGTATEFTVDIFWRVKASTVTITEKGSGYVGTETFTFTKAGSTAGTVPAGTIVLTTDSGRQGGGGNATTNQENAIVIRAKTTSGGTAKVGDIQAQKGSHRYKVKTADGIAVCKLVTTTSLAVNQAYLVATATGGTYYVTKLTSRRAVLVTKTGDGALNGQSVKWTFGSPSATVVQIENA